MGAWGSGEGCGQKKRGERGEENIRNQENLVGGTVEKESKKRHTIIEGAFICKKKSGTREMPRDAQG